jgi:hypothetical protein
LPLGPESTIPGSISASRTILKNGVDTTSGKNGLGSFPRKTMLPVWSPLFMLVRAPSQAGHAKLTTEYSDPAWDAGGWFGAEKI